MAEKEDNIELENEEEQKTLSGKSVFVVNTTTAGISVETAFVSDDGKLIKMPAVFPDVDYALFQIDQLRQMVSKHFSEAARVGAQVIADQAKEQNKDLQ